MVTSLYSLGLFDAARDAVSGAVDIAEDAVVTTGNVVEDVVDPVAYQRTVVVDQDPDEYMGPEPDNVDWRRPVKRVTEVKTTEYLE